MHSKQQEIQTIVQTLNSIKKSTPDQALVQLIDETSKVGLQDLA